MPVVTLASDRKKLQMPEVEFAGFAPERCAFAESAFASAVAQIDRSGGLEPIVLKIAPGMVGREVQEIGATLYARLAQEGVEVPLRTIVAYAQLIHDGKTGQVAK